GPAEAPGSAGVNGAALLADDASARLMPAGLAETLTVTFDDRPGQARGLSGQYPTGIIDWGSGQWYHSQPWRKLTSKSVGFNGPSINRATFTLLVPVRLARLDAYNGGTSASTLTLSCAGLPDKTTTIAADQLLTVETGWATP